jgi:hypothetical protein
MAREISLTVRHKLRDMAISIRETIAGKSVTVVREVLLRKSGETVLYKMNSSHYVVLQKVV